jgi:hypothetical protein
MEYEERKNPTKMVSAHVHLGLCELLSRCSVEASQRLFDILLDSKTVSVNDTQAIVAFSISVLDASLKPSLCHRIISLDPFSSQVHSAKKRGTGSSIANRFVLVFGRQGTRWVIRPNFACDEKEVFAGELIVSRDSSNAFATGGNPPWRCVDTSLVEDLAETVGKVNLSAFRIELKGKKSSQD